MYKLFAHTSEDMHELADNSVALAVTSPPYNVGKEYEQNWTDEYYNQLIATVYKEVYRVLLPGGRFCVNVNDFTDGYRLPLLCYHVGKLMQTGFEMRHIITWIKVGGGRRNQAWGTYMSPANPFIRAKHEYIIVVRKVTDKKHTALPNTENTKPDITSAQFMWWTRSVWNMGVAHNRKDHPATFPVELPARCIKLYTYPRQTVLDPFMGVGATGVAALALDRDFVGYEVIGSYVDIARERLESYLANPTPLKFTEPTPEVEKEIEEKRARRLQGS